MKASGNDVESAEAGVAVCLDFQTAVLLMVWLPVCSSTVAVVACLNADFCFAEDLAFRNLSLKTAVYGAALYDVSALLVASGSASHELPSACRSVLLWNLLCELRKVFGY